MSFSRQITQADGATAKITQSSTSAPTSSNDSTQGYGIGSLWIRSDTGQVWHCRDATTNAAVWLQMEFSNHPGYIVGNWYNPPANSLSVASSGSIKACPFFIKERVTLNSLGMRVSGVSAGGNVQAAIYANNPATGRPTGTPLASTASMSTTTAVNVNAAISLQVDPGLYWFASNCDNATATFIAQSAQTSIASQFIGSATQANALGNQVGMSGVTVAQAFGTWPDLTSGTFVENQAMTPVVQFKIGSVP